jgi:peptidyl-prolyl cis-trans isomerase-like 3
MWWLSPFARLPASRVIDGFDTLDTIEKTPVIDERKHRPKVDLRIRSVTIHANPIAELQG